MVTRSRAKEAPAEEEVEIEEKAETEAKIGSTEILFHKESARAFKIYVIRGETDYSMELAKEKGLDKEIERIFEIEEHAALIRVNWVLRESEELDFWQQIRAQIREEKWEELEIYS